MNKSLSPIQSLDAVLKFMRGSWRSQESSLYDEFKKMTSHEMDYGYFVKVLDRLVFDKYLLKEVHKEVFDSRPREVNYYSITFDGEFFCESGGYETQRKDEDRKKLIDEDRLKRAEKTAKGLNTLTALLAIGTFCLVAIEIIKLCIGK